MPSAAISVENLGKAYRIGLKDEIPDTLVGAATGWVRAPLRNFQNLRRLNTFTANHDDQPDLIWALRDVSFEVPEGEVLGVIGRNGAGKSTLLKILSRITEPTAGRATIHGRVSSLLEVGTGFHQELSGRENIYMNGTILGMRKREIDRKLDQIIDFSGVEKFLDTPIKRYSSGMKVRLAFAVAAHLEPEILIIDEVLAVGDAEFQKKCLGKMHDVATGGRTVLFVSHNLAAVKTLCQKALYLKQGRLSMQGDCDEVIDYYHKELNSGRTDRDQKRSQNLDKSRITSVTFRDQSGQAAVEFGCGAPIEILVHYESSTAIRMPHFGISVYPQYGGQPLLHFDSRCVSAPPDEIKSPGVVICKIPAMKLGPGSYHVNASLSDHHGMRDKYEHAADFTIIWDDIFGLKRPYQIRSNVSVAESMWEYC